MFAQKKSLTRLLFVVVVVFLLVAGVSAQLFAQEQELKTPEYLFEMSINKKSYNKEENEIIHQDNLSEILEEVNNLEFQLEYLIKKRNRISHDSQYSAIQTILPSYRA